MDDQHGILMDAMNELRLAMTHGSGREQLSKLLDQLIEFTRMHFASEEQLMQQTGFAGHEQHRAQHQCLMAQVLQAAHQLQYGKKADMSGLLNFLRDWHTQHIAGPDQQCGAWLNDRGIC
jgi:hemerythrin